MSVFRHPLFHAFKWSAAGELASRVIQPLVFLILARLLTPEDFGVVAAATMVISFSQVFWEAGMAKALIQRQKDVHEAADVAFWINVGLGVLVGGLVFILAEPVAYYLFQDSRVSLVLQVMTVQLVLASLASVHIALLQKQFRFKSLFWVRLLTVALPAFASIPLALNGWSYWALVTGTLLGQGIQTAVLWRVNAWRPRWAFDFQIAREMAGFGAWVALSGLLAWFYVWADALVVGMYLGAHDLGLYRTGNQFVTLLFGIIFSPLLPVLYSHFSEIQAERERLKATYVRVVKVSILVAMPVAFILFAISEQLGALLFGETWNGIGFVIGVMALTHGTSWIIGSNGEAYKAIGKPIIETVSMGGALPIYFFVYVISVKLGFDEFVWARFFLAVVGTILHLLIASHIFSINIVRILSLILMVSLIASTSLLVEYSLLTYIETSFWQLILISLASLMLIAWLYRFSGVYKNILDAASPQNIKL